jgi:very-short-patch-repair endonuclease
MPQSNIIRGQKVNQSQIQLAKELRRTMTEAEKILWEHVRNDQLGGFHIRRQQIIHGRIVDFYCHAASLIVEVDGEVHEFHKSEDREKDDFLIENGFRVLRIRNEEIADNIDAVLVKILEECRKLVKMEKENPPV